MEHKSTEGSKKNVPGQGSSISDTDLLKSFGIEVPEFASVVESSDRRFSEFQRESEQRFSQLSRDIQERSEQLMRDAERESSRIMAETQRWMEEGRIALEQSRSDMDFKEYVDSEGYQVVEGRSKNGYLVIQKMKKTGNQFISKMEIYKDGELTFKTGSNESSYSYRDNTGKMVEVTNTSHVERDRTPKGKRVSFDGNYGKTVRVTPHAKVIKGKKKTTKGWKWLFILAIAALVIYFLFLR